MPTGAPHGQGRGPRCAHLVSLFPRGSSASTMKVHRSAPCFGCYQPAKMLHKSKSESKQRPPQARSMSIRCMGQGGRDFQNEPKNPRFGLGVMGSGTWYALNCRLGLAGLRWLAGWAGLNWEGARVLGSGWRERGENRAGESRRQTCVTACCSTVGWGGGHGSNAEDSIAASLKRRGGASNRFDRVFTQAAHRPEVPRNF